MKTHIEGTSYQYDVISVSKQGKYYFSIKAIHKFSRRTSTINTVNPILSELKIPDTDIKFKESTWEVNKKRSTLLVKKAKELLSNRHYQKYLERILDEDRELSEWENIETSSP